MRMNEQGTNSSKASGFAPDRPTKGMAAIGITVTTNEREVCLVRSEPRNDGEDEKVDGGKTVRAVLGGHVGLTKIAEVQFRPNCLMGPACGSQESQLCGALQR